MMIAHRQGVLYHPQTRVPDVSRSSNARDLTVEGSQLDALLWVVFQAVSIQTNMYADDDCGTARSWLRGVLNTTLNLKTQIAK
jgi:hypothetical protein